MSINGTTRAILRRPLSRAHRRHIEQLPEHLRLGALWRTLKFGDPWPRHSRPFIQRNDLTTTEADPLRFTNTK
jgi:hypothetical protein